MRGSVDTTWLLGLCLIDSHTKNQIDLMSSLGGIRPLSRRLNFKLNILFRYGLNDWVLIDWLGWHLHIFGPYGIRMIPWKFGWNPMKNKKMRSYFAQKMSLSIYWSSWFFELLQTFWRFSIFARKWHLESNERFGRYYLTFRSVSHWLTYQKSDWSDV